MEKNDHPITLSIFFCGTNGSITPRIGAVTNQINLFAKANIGVELSHYTDPDDLQITGSDHYKLYFDGCGMTNGSWGALFGYGLYEQCSVVLEKIEMLQNRKRPIILIGLGLSRGAIALLMLQNRLNAIGPLPDITYKMVLLDPVPGNLITQGKFDIFGLSNTERSIDVSQPGGNITDAYILYPYRPLPDFAFHAPLIPIFSSTTSVEMDVISGCHQGAFFDPNMSTECHISFFMIKEKLVEFGMKFNEKFSNQVPDEKELLKILQTDLNYNQLDFENTVRYTHSRDNSIIIHQNYGTYFNKYHEKLVRRSPEWNNKNKENEASKVTYMCYIKPQNDWLGTWRGNVPYC